MRSFPDPHWITARWAASCTGCLRRISPGDKAFYYPASKSLYCIRVECGQNAALDFTCAVQHENTLKGTVRP